MLAFILALVCGYLMLEYSLSFVLFLCSSSSLFWAVSMYCCTAM
uniref:Uncharacterized protein n=1 Tax=Anguilla anguilla TaxID=7936 RepID=A0A0E9RMZ9_ANGAN